MQLLLMEPREDAGHSSQDGSSFNFVSARASSHELLFFTQWFFDSGFAQELENIGASMGLGQA